MTTFIHERDFEPFLESRRSFLLLRWTIIILTAYLTLFSNLGSRNFVAIFAFAAAFAASNVVMGLLPERLFVIARARPIVPVTDAIFICGFLLVLRTEGPPVHFAMMGILALTLIWRDLRVVLFSIWVVSILFGVFSFSNFVGTGVPVPMDDFVTLALFFVVAVFYVFLIARFDREAVTKATMFDESRTSAVMVEIARRLSTSMNAEEIYKEIVTRLQETTGGAACSVVRIEGDEAAIIASTEELPETGRAIQLVDAPALSKAYAEGEAVFMTEGEKDGPEEHRSAAIPILVREEITAMIYLEGGRSQVEPSSTAIHFFELVASTAGNALRNIQMFEEMKYLARTDFLTGLPNHRFFQTALSREVSRAHRHGHTLSVLMIDMDFLKTVNDQFGHPAGDSVIRNVAKTIQGTCRDIDFAARYGGEEFVVILPETDLDGAVQVAERVRQEIQETEVGVAGQVTASIGVANYPANATSKEDLIRVADQALYVAKNGGRNQVSHFPYQLTSTM